MYGMKIERLHRMILATHPYAARAALLIRGALMDEPRSKRMRFKPALARADFDGKRYG